MKVIYMEPEGKGWAPIALAARLTAELLEAELVVVPTRPERAQFRRLAALAPRRRGGDDCLVIASAPGALRALLSFDHLLRGHRQVAGWVIDSFWDARIPSVARGRDHFDQFFVTDPDDVDTWATLTGRPTSSVPIGSNVLDLGSGSPDRPIDLRRYGRQPAAWHDDAAVAAECAAAGITFGGRLQEFPDPERNQRSVLAELAGTKFGLAFSPQTSPAHYTHPTRDYFTARWSDLLSAGAVIAGISPTCGAAEELLWPGAVLELGTTDREIGLGLIVEAIADWTPQRAATNHLMALRRLDLRWRIAAIAEAMGIATARLDTELARLRSAIAAAGSSAV